MQPSDRLFTAWARLGVIARNNTERIVFDDARR
jgi:hypothetical protein